MNPEVKTEWLRALSSGEYVQAVGSLHEVGTEGDDRYCCLGVLCELAVKAGVTKRRTEVNPTDPWGRKMEYGYGNAKDMDTCYLPDEVLKWSGLGSRTGVLPEGTNARFDHHSLANANDVGKSFEDIADLIEEHF